MQEQEPQEIGDLGWQRPTASSRKFHYFAVDGNREWQRSLCGRYGLPPIPGIEPDVEPPNDESCKKCSTLWEKAYGSRPNPE